MSKTTAWRKSTFSNDQSACVEIAGTLDAVRDSKNPAPQLELTGPGLAVFIRRLKAGL